MQPKILLVMTDTSADSEVTGGFLDGAKFRVYAFEYIKFYFKIAPNKTWQSCT